LRMVDDFSSGSNVRRFNRSGLDWRSYQLGVIAAFAEVVQMGCKRLALSSPMTEDQYTEIIDQARLIAEERNVVLYVDDDFLETRLFDPEHTEGKIVIHIAVDQETVDDYLALKGKKRDHTRDGTLTDEKENQIAWSLGRLLSYDNRSIERLITNRGYKP